MPASEGVPSGTGSGSGAVPSGGGEPLLSVENLHTHFWSPDGVVKAVNGVSFTLQPGETLGIVGESGSGKSVTALSLMRLVAEPPGRIVGGRVVFDGTDLLGVDRKTMRAIRGRDIAMIFQDPMTSLNPTMTVGQQMAEPLRLHEGLSKAQAKGRCVELLRAVGIPAPERRVTDYPHQFSGGMRQRVMIAMAMACGPQLIIADEPTTALDVTIQAQILELMKHAVTQRGTALILISHDLGVVAGVCSRVAVMYAGQMVERASTPELYARPRHPYTRGLLSSVPRLDEDVAGDLDPIPGQPPNLIADTPGCPFAPRCASADEQCRTTRPPLRPVPGDPDDHDVACWHPVDDAMPVLEVAS